MSSGFSFGAKTTAAPTFGTTITFENTPATMQPGQQFGFGNLASTQPTLFGTQSAPTTSSLGFKAPGFGAATTTPSTGFGLSAPGSGFSFGTTTPSFGATAVSSAPSGGLSFGTPAASTATSFGTPASSSLAFKPPTTGLSFGTPASTGLSFSTPASTALGFGTGTSTPASTGLTFGTSTVAPTTGLNFGTTSSAPTLGLSFGAPSTGGIGLPTSSTGLAFGTSTASSGLPNLGLGGFATSTAATSVPQNVGLGGIASTQAKIGMNATAQKELPPKEQLLPNEFTQTVDQLKNWIQDEKNRSSEVARCSVKEYHKVETELDSLNHQFSQVENQLLNNRNLAEQLKYDTAKGLQNIEMAQRTQDTPPSLQYDNTAPLQFFLDLTDNFEREMQLLKLKIDNTEKFVKKCNEPSILTSQDLALGLKRLHETFVALAGRMQSVHSQVETQKEAFLSLRKQAIKDNVNPFEKLNKNVETMSLIMRNVLKTSPPNLASGPTPFNNIALGSNNIAMAAQQSQPPAYPTATTNTLGFGFSTTTPAFGMPSANNSMFKPTGFGAQPFQLNTSTNFQLQKPPTGNKRGKQ